MFEMMIDLYEMFAKSAKAALRLIFLTQKATRRDHYATTTMARHAGFSAIFKTRTAVVNAHVHRWQTIYLICRLLKLFEKLAVKLL